MDKNQKFVNSSETNNRYNLLSTIIFFLILHKVKVEKLDLSFLSSTVHDFCRPPRTFRNIRHCSVRCRATFLADSCAFLLLLFSLHLRSNFLALFVIFLVRMLDCENTLKVLFADIQDCWFGLDYLLKDASDVSRIMP